MDTRRVLVYESGQLLGACAEKLLAKEQDIEVVCVPAGCEDDLFKAIERYQPSALIVGREMAIVSASCLAKVFIKFPALCVVTISENDNWLHMYHKEDRLLSQGSDLADAIRSRNGGG